MNESEREVKLHKQFEFWDKSTTLTRYLMVMFMGAAIQDFSFDSLPSGMVFNIFVLSVLINIFCQYLTEYKLSQIVKGRTEQS